MTPDLPDDLPELVVPDAAAWRAWLAEHHADAPGVWLVLTRKGGTTTTVTWDQAVDEALCFGWIDGQARRRDEESSRQRMTPRRARSMWSRKNVERVERLEREGRMTAAGRAQVEAAKADGRWDRAYAGPATAEVPDDLAEALAGDPAAQRWWDALTSANRYAILHRVGGVRRPETRARKIAEMVTMLAEGRTIHPQKRRPADDVGPAVGPAVDPSTSRTS